ncbi:hypothetical protein B0T18DRAFT_247826 [Schizothecium vesticola]|uniref:Uncharacterized protein n=1 Tax=Schizothecium vesticola TaxID=314040 RepID=A0AA40BQE4_9PEZI|nr:hypothetical protein B0T18DRAFT_247826 [Schizothecium vesticola]
MLVWSGRVDWAFTWRASPDFLQRAIASVAGWSSQIPIVPIWSRGTVPKTLLVPNINSPTHEVREPPLSNRGTDSSAPRQGPFSTILAPCLIFCMSSPQRTKTGSFDLSDGERPSVTALRPFCRPAPALTRELPQFSFRRKGRTTALVSSHQKHFKGATNRFFVPCSMSYQNG